MLTRFTRTICTTWQRWNNLPLWAQIFIALSLGVILGLVFGKSPLAIEESKHGSLVNSLYHSYTALHPYGHAVIKSIWPIGRLFINAIKMMIVPVVFVSIVCGVISISNPKYLGKISLKAMTIYLSTMGTSVVIGLSCAKLFNPGNIALPSDQLITHGHSLIAQTSMTDIFVHLIPSNPVAAFANNDILQVVVFAIIIGISIILSGNKGKPIAEFFQALSEVVMNIPRLVLKYAPYGVFALMAYNTEEHGFNVLGDIFLTILALYLGCIIQGVLVYSAILKFKLKLSPLQFYKGILEAMTFAFSTTSSAATLPYTIYCVEHNLGVSKRITNFVMPLGATVNMNGLAVYLGITAIFASNIAGVDLNLWQLVTVILTGTLSAIGAAGVPAAALVVMSLVMDSVGFSAGVVAVVLGFFSSIDSILGMMSTTLNVTGDALTSVIIAKQEGELNEAIYNHKETKARVDHMPDEAEAEPQTIVSQTAQ